MGTHKEHDGNKAKKKKNFSHPSSLKRKKLDPSLPYAEPYAISGYLFCFILISWGCLTTNFFLNQFDCPITNKS
jgi:hypothetical protein